MPTSHSTYKARPMAALNIFSTQLTLVTVIKITFLPFNISTFQHIYNNCSRLARAPVRSLSVKTPLAPLGSPRDNEMETVAGSC